jgi:hypothetical protein
VFLSCFGICFINFLNDSVNSCLWWNSFVIVDSVAAAHEPAAIGAIAISGLFLVRRRRQSL